MLKVHSADELRAAMRRSDHPLAFDGSGLDRVLRLDAKRGLVEVQAATSWSALAAWLHGAGIELPGFAGDPFLPPSVGESVAANAPGPDGRAMVAHLDGIALVTADGELRRLNRFAGRDLLFLAAGGHGAFGPAYSVTLNLGSLLAGGAAPSTELLELPASNAGRPRSLSLLAPPERAQQVLADARALCAEWRVAIEGVAVRRTLAEEETYLRWATRDYAWIRLALREPAALGASVLVGQLCGELIALAIAAGGGYPIADTFAATREQAIGCYPRLPGFLAEQRRYDGAERLDNRWLRHLRGLLGRERCEVRFSREPARVDAPQPAAA